MQRLTISSKFANSKCDHFRLFIVCGESLTNYYIVIKKMKAFGNGKLTARYWF